METDLQPKWHSVGQAISGEGIHSNCPFAAVLPSNHWALWKRELSPPGFLMSSDFASKDVIPEMLGMAMWAAQTGRVIWREVGERYTPPHTCTPFPGELDQGQCAALAEKIKHGLSVGQTAGQVNGASEAAGHLISTDIRGHPCLSQSTQAVNDKWAWNYFICYFVYIYELHDHSTKRTKAHLFLSNKCSVEFFGVYSEAQNETHLGRVTSKCYSCHYLTVTAL